MYLKEMTKLLVEDNFHGDFDKTLELLGHVAGGVRHKRNLKNLLNHLVRSEDSKEVLESYLDFLVFNYRYKDILTFHCVVHEVDNLSNIFTNDKAMNTMVEFMIGSNELDPTLFAYLVSFNNGQFQKVFLDKLQTRKKAC